MLLMKTKHRSALIFVTTVNSSSVIYHANVSIKNTARNTYDISLPCTSVYCQTAPKDRFNPAKELYSSIGTSFLSCHIFLSLYWQSLPSIVLSIHSKEHSHHYFTRKPIYFDIWREISIFLLSVFRKRLFGDGLPNLSKFYGAVFV